MPKRKPRPWSTGPSAEFATAPASSGVKSETMTSATAKTAAKPARMPSSQLVPIRSERIGISRISGSTEGAKQKPARAATIQPRIDSDSRARPRA